MPKRRTAPGDVSKIVYHVRTDGQSWRSADPSDTTVSRARYGRTWRARTLMGRADGTTTRLSRTGPTPSAALSALELVIAQERRRAMEAGSAVPTLGDLIAWAVERIQDGRDPKVRSENSVLKYVNVAHLWAGHPLPEPNEDEGDRRAHIARTEPHASRVRDIRIDELTPADLADELERIAALGAGSLPHLRALWRKATARAIALRYISADPAAGVPMPARTSDPAERIYANGAPRPLNNSLTDAQLAELRQKVTVRSPQQRFDVSDLIVLETYTGLRINEINSLRWIDVHLDGEDPHLRIVGQMYGSGSARHWEPQLKREQSRRVVPLTAAAADLLRKRHETAWAASKEGSAVRTYVFPTYRGEIPDLAVTKKAVRRALDRAGFRWATIHTLRRTVERQLMDARVDPRVIMSVMGHDPATSWSAYVDARSVDVSVAKDALG